MNIALMLHHGVRDNALSETTSHPHLELMASTPHDRERLKVLAEQLNTFGTIPFSYKEMEATDPALRGAVIRIALCQRTDDASAGASGS